MRTISAFFCVISFTSLIQYDKLSKDSLSKRVRPSAGDTRDVVDNHRCVAVAYVVRNKVAEAFLAGGVPKLELDFLAPDVNGLRQEVDSDGCLQRMLHGTAYAVFAGEGVVYEPVNDARLSYRLVAQEDDLELGSGPRPLRHGIAAFHVA